MTGFSQVKAAGAAGHGFIISLKSVNHRFLEVHLRLPSDMNVFEMKVRRILKERLSRGRVEVSLSFETASVTGMTLNHAWIKDYVALYREAASQHGFHSEPDLNQILKAPGAFVDSAPRPGAGPEWDIIAEQALNQAIDSLDLMRAEEGRELARDLAHRMQLLEETTREIALLRAAVSAAYCEKIRSRMTELTAGNADPARILQEAAMLAERSDIEEETVRMLSHIRHFAGLLDSTAEAGKKMDFLLQEMNREANTMLSKTSGVAGQGLRITELGLSMKAEIEKSREQVQNIE